MSESANNHRPRVARSGDKISLTARQDRTGVIKSTAPNGPLWANQVVQLAGDALILAGSKLAAGQVALLALEAQVEAARKDIATLRITWDESYTVYVGSVELAAVKPEDITKSGLVLLDEATNHLAPPLGVTVTYDAKAAVIRVAVRKPRGDYGCMVEISPDPITPDSFKRLKGSGARRALAGYPPGGYWVRVAMCDKEDESAFSPLVFVTVK